MFNPKIIFPLFILIFLGEISFAQSDTLNQKDSLGLKQGYWIVYGKDMPERGFPVDGKIEEGNYLNDKKNGIWTMYHNDGITRRVEGTFVNGRPNGPYIKYYQNGVIAETSTYLNGKQIGEFYAYHENGCLRIKKYYNSEGREDGETTFYYQNCDTAISVFGEVEFQYQKVNGVTPGERPIYPPDIKEQVTYDTSGGVIEVYRDTFVIKSDRCSGPNGSVGIKKDGKLFLPDGYNKIYNEQDELWMDGVFKDSKLWEGKYYKYDDDGILLKYEIWKNGCYHSDGQL